MHLNLDKNVTFEENDEQISLWIDCHTEEEARILNRTFLPAGVYWIAEVQQALVGDGRVISISPALLNALLDDPDLASLSW